MTSAIAKMLTSKKTNEPPDMKAHPLSLANGVLKYQEVYQQIVQ